MGDEMAYRDVPISAAKQIAEEFDKDQVIIVTWDSAFGLTHVTTYGKSKGDSIQAAQGGNVVKRALGWPDKLCEAMPEWYMKERAVLVQALKYARLEFEEAENSIYPLMFTDVINELQAAIDQAEAQEKP